jgi:hypothetical protein
MLIVFIIIVFTASYLALVTTYGFYFFKYKALSKTLSIQTQKMSKMLNRTLHIQLIAYSISVGIPLCIIGAMYFLRIANANLIVHVCIASMTIYPILEIFTLLYFIKPYKEYMKFLMNKIMVMLKLRKTQPAITNKIRNIVNAKLFTIRVVPMPLPFQYR